MVGAIGCRSKEAVGVIDCQGYIDHWSNGLLGFKTVSVIGNGLSE